MLECHQHDHTTQRHALINVASSAMDAPATTSELVESTIALELLAAAGGACAWTSEEVEAAVADVGACLELLLLLLLLGLAASTLSVQPLVAFIAARDDIMPICKSISFTSSNACSSSISSVNTAGTGSLPISGASPHSESVPSEHSSYGSSSADTVVCKSFLTDQVSGVKSLVNVVRHVGQHSNTPSLGLWDF